MSALWLGYAVFAAAAAAPGPSTMAIMGLALAQGRRAACAFAMGVVCGSCLWGLAAAAGVTAILASSAWALSALKGAGALYLAWMAWNAGRAALSAAAPAARPPARSAHWRRGVALHLTNPKAMLGWASVIAVGLPVGSGAGHVALLLGGCAAMAVVINLGYAMAFSAEGPARAYRAARRWIEGGLAALFGAAALGLLAWRPAA